MESEESKDLNFEETQHLHTEEVGSSSTCNTTLAAPLNWQHQSSTLETRDQANKLQAHRAAAAEAGVGAFHVNVDLDWLVPTFPGDAPTASQTTPEVATSENDNATVNVVESHVEILRPSSSLDINIDGYEKDMEEELFKCRRWVEFGLFIALAVGVMLIMLTLVEPSKRAKSNSGGDKAQGGIAEVFPTLAPTTMIRHCNRGNIFVGKPEKITRTARYQAIRSVLEIKLEQYDGAVFNKTCEPHDLALSWLADKDRLQLITHVGGTAMYQRFAAALLFFSTDMQTKSWLADSSWLSHRHECLWKGITCGKNSSIFVDRIHTIHLPNQNLAGSIPNEFNLLLPFLSK
eukprot:scaffold93170_cov32-Attheya_sp.AAC.2